MADALRVVILCEDRRTERLLRALCDRYSVRVVDVDDAPEGRGAASAYVVRRYAGSVKKLRSKSFQRNLGLVVATDGDNVGSRSRSDALAAELEPPRTEKEPIAILVPTWSVEPWLAALNGIEGVVETRSLKEDPDCRKMWADGATERATFRRAADAWRSAPSPLPALAAAYEEATRVGL
ncbi:MAG: hypothetical protein HYY06_32650 [Deltaproteobacteria bacterium]|nr:hypothetical protein [Deltaproteobacteria bacterium]